jgi:hypothetical protein
MLRGVATDAADNQYLNAQAEEHSARLQALNSDMVAELARLDSLLQGARQSDQAAQEDCACASDQQGTTQTTAIAIVRAGVERLTREISAEDAQLGQVLGCTSTCLRVYLFPAAIIRCHRTALNQPAYLIFSLFLSFFLHSLGM